MNNRSGGRGFQDWGDLRHHAIEQFNGETPNALTEDEIIQAYELHPDAVERAVDAVATDFRAGSIRSGWAILKKRCASISAPPANPQRNTSISREKRIMRAEQWIRNAGIHYPTIDEILLELFGSENALLRADAQIDLEENPAWQSASATYAPTSRYASTGRPPSTTTPTPSSTSPSPKSSPSSTLPKPPGPTSPQTKTHATETLIASSEHSPTSSPNARWRLSQPRGDTTLIHRITTLWNEARPTGEALEHDAEARARAWIKQHTPPAANDDDLPL